MASGLNPRTSGNFVAGEKCEHSLGDGDDVFARVRGGGGFRFG